MRYQFVPMIEDVVRRIQERLDALGKTAAKASVEAGLSKDAIRNIQRIVNSPTPSRRTVTTHTIAALAPVLETTSAWLLEGDPVSDTRAAMVPLIGFVGAGGEAIFSNGQGPFGEVDAPPRYTHSTVAVEVRGDSMPGVAEHGWILYYDDVRAPVDESFLGRKAPVVVGLDNGRVLVKRIKAGTKPGYYHLLSTGGEDPIVDARVTWAARITWIKPRWD
jgi:phage repressor protein C with HTH and peptisase S24 domain